MIASSDRPETTAADAVDAVAQGIFLLDVREQNEWVEGHAPGATLIPLSELSERTAEVPQGRPVLVVCHSGMRSARATEALRGVGVDAVNVAGGMLAWRDAGGDVVTGDDASGRSAG